ncbi:hypothetical protein ACFV84_00860 [Kitasatospora sp. NPDC059811]|uniref:hypothetical protein n=1 Tax=Streptomycetaceae TaxID=2062 RepID=UPI0007AFC756|nr:hypothetical protein [Streptomyces sp. MJM8645]
MKQQYVTMALAGLLIGILAFGAGWYTARARETAPAPTYITVTPEPVTAGTISPPASAGAR